MAPSIVSSRLRRIAAAVLVVALVATACSSSDDGDEAGPSTTLDASPQLRKVLDAAQAEGKLKLSWAGVLGDVKGAPELAKGFKDYYGLDIDVEFTPGGGQSQMASKVEQELRADLPASSDILSLTSTAVIQLARRGVLEKVDWAGFAANVTDPKMVAPNGVAVGVEAWPFVIAYHTGRVQPDEVPKSMADLLKRKYKDRIYTTPLGLGFDLLASDHAWGEERTLDYARKFSRQVGGLGFTIQPLLSGEFDIMALLVPPSFALAAKEDGAPIGTVVPSDATLFYENFVGIPANSPHPNSARLFIDYLMSPQGQALLRKLDFVDSPLVKGSITANQINKAKASGDDFVYGDLAFYAAYDPELYKRIATDVPKIMAGR
jgi:ABC-type Fe3+ transport system substrate-binding protein